MICGYCGCCGLAEKPVRAMKNKLVPDAVEFWGRRKRKKGRQISLSYLFSIKMRARRYFKSNFHKLVSSSSVAHHLTTINNSRSLSSLPTLLSELSGFLCNCPPVLL